MHRIAPARREMSRNVSPMRESAKRTQFAKNVRFPMRHNDLQPSPRAELPSVARGAYPRLAAEGFAELVGAAEARRLRDARHAGVGFDEQPFGALDAHPADLFGGAAAQGAAEAHLQRPSR